jgi:hypothetical protein
MWPLQTHMCHALYTRTPNPHMPVKPRGLALIPLVTPCLISGPAVLTPDSSLWSYIVPRDQHESFVRTLSSLMRTWENFPIGQPSQIASSQARLTWRFFLDRLQKKKMHLICMDTLLILLSLGLGYYHPRGQDITVMWQQSAYVIELVVVLCLLDGSRAGKALAFSRPS